MTLGKGKDWFARAVEALSGDKRVSFNEGKGFGSGALKTGGKIFAMVSSRGDFVVKLPKTRVDSLVEEGMGERFDPGHGRLMKEWFVLKPGKKKADPVALAREALEFVAKGKK